MIALADTIVQSGAGGRGPAAWEGSAVFSRDELYRYYLDRRFVGGLFTRRTAGPLVVLMLNPSTADAFANDPTIGRLCALAYGEGFQHLVVANAYALRSPHPKALAAAADPVGPANDEAIRLVLEMARPHGMVLCAWGSHAPARKRARQVTRMALDIAGPEMLYTMTLTTDGSPGHPLDRRGGLTKADRRPSLWAGAAAYAEEDRS